MTFTQELRHKHHDLWHRMVTHPFVIEMGDGTLPAAKFRAYFLQDYVFVHDLVALTSMGLAEAPTFLAANQLHQFLAGILNPENDLFVRAFTELGVSTEEYAAVSASPITQAFGDFLVRTGLEGSFEDIVTVLYVTEGTYLDWGTRLLEAGKRPASRSIGSGSISIARRYSAPLWGGWASTLITPNWATTDLASIGYSTRRCGTITCSGRRRISNARWPDQHGG